MEPHADFMAGWAIIQYPEYWHKKDLGEGRALLSLKVAVETLFAKGDALFNSPTHHGEPEFRAAMALAGFDAGYDAQQWFSPSGRLKPALTLAQAFEKGAAMASLNLKAFCEPTKNQFAVCGSDEK